MKPPVLNASRDLAEWHKRLVRAKRALLDPEVERTAYLAVYGSIHEHVVQTLTDEERKRMRYVKDLNLSYGKQLRSKRQRA